MEPINLQPLSLSEIYTSASLDLKGPGDTGKASQNDAVTNQAVIKGKHSFQMPPATQPKNLEIESQKLELPQQPLPLQNSKEKHGAESNSLEQAMVNRPDQDKKNLANLAAKLGFQGQDVLKALMDTHAFQTRMLTNDQPLTPQEMEKLTQTAEELKQDLEDGTATLDTLLTRANAKQFKLTSTKDMAEVLRNTFKQVNQLSMDTGYADFHDFLNQKLDTAIKSCEQELCSLLKQSNLEHPENLLRHNVIKPTDQKDPYDSSRFLNFLRSQVSPYQELLQPESIATLGMELFDLKQRQLRLQDATQQVVNARSELMGIRPDTKLTLPLDPTADETQTAKEILKESRQTVKRFQQAGEHSTDKLGTAHKAALDKLFDLARENKDILPKNYGRPDTEVVLGQFHRALNFHAQTLQATRQQLQFAMAQPARQELMARQLADIRKLHSTGGSRAMNGAVALNIPAEIMGIPAAGGLSLSYSYVLDIPHAGGAISAANVKGLTVSLSAGNKKVCSVKVSAGMMLSDAKLFSTPEAFVEHNTDKMLTAILLKRSFMFHKPGAGNFDKQQWIAITNNQLLLNRLNVLGAIKTGDELDSSDLKTTKALYNEVKTTTKLVKGDLNVAGNTLHNGTTLSHSKTKMILTSNLFQALEMDPRLFAKQKHQYYMNETTDLTDKAVHPYAQLQSLKVQIDTAKDFHNRADLEKFNGQLFSAMEQLDAEFQTYTNIVNEYEVKSAHRSAFEKKIRHLFHISDSHSVEGQLLDLKTNFEKGRSAKNRGEYIRAIMVTHAQLKKLYDITVQGLKDTPTTKATQQETDLEAKRLKTQGDKIAQFKEEYSNPQMRLDHKRHVQRYLAIHKTSKVITNSVENDTSFTMPAGIPAGVDIKITHKNVKRHHFHSQQAKTLTMDFSLNSGNINLFPATIKAIAGHYNDGSLPVRAMMATARDMVAGAALMAGQNITKLGRSSAVHFQLNLIKGADKDYHIQMLNIFSEAKLNAGTKNPTLNVAGGTTETNIIAQYVGDNSLNYPLTKYLFTRTPGQPMPPEWDTFIQKNQKNIRTLLVKALTDGTHPNQEVKEYFKLVEGAEDQFLAFQDKCKDMMKDPDSLNDKQVNDTFQELCQLLAGYETNISATKLKDKDYNR